LLLLLLLWPTFASRVLNAGMSSSLLPPISSWLCTHKEGRQRTAGGAAVGITSYAARTWQAHITHNSDALHATQIS
jgi:hypothetical protein